MDRIEFLSEFIYESDMIEQIQDKRETLIRQLQNQKQDGHVGAILYLESLAKIKGRVLIEKDILKIQDLITEEQGIKRPDLKLKPEHIGKYRTISMRINGEKRAHHSLVPGLMENLILQIQDWQKNWKKLSEMDNLAALADIHYGYEIIHPFYDGNGRSGRAIILYLFLYMGKEPFVFTNYDKYLFYYPPFKRKDKVLMRNYFYRKTGNLQ